MQVWEAQHARADAMLKLDEGDLPGARRALDVLIAQLTPSEGQLRSELAQAHIDRATVERFANDWNAALTDLELADSLAHQLPMLARRSLLTNVHLLRAKIHSTSFSHAFDLARAQSALDHLSSMWPGHWMVEELDSHVAFQRHEWDRAAAKALRAASMMEREGWARGVAACRRRAGDALLEMSHLDEAEQHLLAALAFFEEHGPPDLLSETRLAVARLESRRGNHDAAWTSAEQALGEVEARVRRFIDIAEQQRFLIDKLRFYDYAFDIGLARGTGSGVLRAWTVAERSKSFYLAQLLANADVPLFEGVDPALVKTLDALEIELDTSERALGMRPPSSGDGSEARELESRIRNLSDRRSATLQAIMNTNARWARLRNPRAFDATDLAGQLPAGVCPLSFFWRDSAAGAILHIFARSAAGLPVHSDVAWSAAQLDELAAHAERLHGQVDEYADLFPEGMTDRVLPSPLRQQLPGGACLLVSPHGRLRGLPLHALPLDDSILIAHWPIQYVPSLALPASATSEASPTSVLLMGSPSNAFGDPPLKDVESELSELEEIWKASARTVVAKVIDADRSPADAGWPPQRWSQFDLLHFACHGRFSESRPLDSALRLGGDAVRGSELFATKLNARVVALSACALGQRAQRYGDTEVVSEEWIGLYLPLFYAGARSLVVSLWDAHSRVARQFMVAFHQALADGGEPHIAFQKAMDRVRARLPARWANWCLVGLPTGS